MKKILALILSLVITFEAEASECLKPVSLLEESAPAPCRGYLFSPEKELEVRLLKKNSELDKQEIESLNKIVDRLSKINQENEVIQDKKDQQIDLWKVRAETSTLKLTEQQSGQQTRDFLHVLAGIGLTVLAAWSMGQLK